ncbi:MAG: NAD(P)/FAD-dependent oxidoreductase [Clostridia bacterium]|nr:NAD(P)/FAD-dependent oxidoreductase [Clostridia bacterium]
MKQAIVIGAGPAGLTAAYELVNRSADWQVTVLEAQDAVGGISKTVCVDGNRMDLGGHRFFSKDPQVVELWKRLLAPQGAPSLDDALLGRPSRLTQGGPDPSAQDEVLLTRRRVSRIYYKRNFFDYPISMSWKTLRRMGFFTTMRAGCSYLAACLHKRRENSLEDFYINRFGRVLYRMFFEGYTEKLWGRHPRDISADWGAQRVKGLSIRAVLRDIWDKWTGRKNRHVETSLIEEFYYPKYGPGQMWETMAEQIRLKGGQIRSGCPVVGVVPEGEGARILFTEQGQTRTVWADAVFSSMPLCDLARALGDALPPSARDVAVALPYRDVVTVGLLVDRLALKNDTDIPTLGDVVPDCWIYVQDTGVKLGRIQIFNNWSPYLVKDPLKTVWLGLEFFCREGDDFWNMPQQQCVDQAVRELVSMGVLAQDAAVLDAHRERVSKAYPAYFDSYGRIDQLISQLNAFPFLYCIGRNGQHRYNNMDHSMVTAMRAVQLLLTGEKDRTVLWNVNVEQEYHETASDQAGGR